MPARTMTLIGTDANGHVGSLREYTSEVPFRQDPHRAQEDYIHVGANGREVENQNGTLLREFLERDNMVAVNTKSARASGKTWYGGRKPLQGLTTYWWTLPGCTLTTTRCWAGSCTGDSEH